MGEELGTQFLPRERSLLHSTSLNLLMCMLMTTMVPAFFIAQVARAVIAVHRGLMVKR